MYATDWTSLLSRTHRNCSACAGCPHATASPRPAGAGRRLLPLVSPTVWALGFTSLFTDISSEMVASVLPMYLVLQLGMQPFAFGVIDGLYQGVAAVVRIVGGVVADRWRRHKEVATSGYALSALCRVGLLALSGTWPALAGIVAIDRIGKGVRTAPRDALISLRSPCRDLATAFGVHRALDAAGAMLGPLVAFLVLAAAPQRFDVLFAASFAIAIVGLAIIVLFVDSALPATSPRTLPLSMRRSPDVLRAPRFRAILIAGFLLGLPTISDAFIFLSLQRRLEMGVTAFPLFYVATSLFMGMFSMPFGTLADRVGRKPVFLGGYVLFAAVYVTLFLPQTAGAMVLVPLVLLGAYYAATDGVLTAMAASVLAPTVSGTGLSMLATATNVSKLVASVLFGLMWTTIGLTSATAWYLGALVFAIAAAGVVLHRAERPAAATVLASS
jgi:MFS family permease